MGFHFFRILRLLTGKARGTMLSTWIRNQISLADDPSDVVDVKDIHIRRTYELHIE